MIDIYTIENDGYRCNLDKHLVTVKIKHRFVIYYPKKHIILSAPRLTSTQLKMIDTAAWQQQQSNIVETKHEFYIFTNYLQKTVTS